MSASSTYASKPPATIVLDACTLYSMAYTVPDKFKRPNATPPITTYLDMLPHLANHGVRILIPEIVSIEVARVLADGRDVDDLFSNRIPHVHESAFLKAVAHHAFPNIEIVANTGPSEADKFCHTMHQAMDSITHVHADDIPNDSTAITARNRIIEAERTTNKQDLGDKAILSLVASLRSSVKPKKLFVLTEDRDLGRKLDQSICRLRFRTFMHHMVNSGFATQAGLKPGIGADDLAKDICLRRHGNEFAKFSREFDGKETAEMILEMRQRSQHFLDMLREVKSQAYTTQLQSVETPSPTIDVPSITKPAPQLLGDAARTALLDKFGAPKTNDQKIQK